MVGRRKSSSGNPISNEAVPGQSKSSTLSATARAKSKKVRNGFIAKRKYFDKEVQTVDLDLVTSGMYQTNLQIPQFYPLSYNQVLIRVRMYKLCDMQMCFLQM